VFLKQNDSLIEKYLKMTKNKTEKKLLFLAVTRVEKKNQKHQKHVSIYFRDVV
jgi:hypothetical protein